MKNLFSQIISLAILFVFAAFSAIAQNSKKLPSKTESPTIKSAEQKADSKTSQQKEQKLLSPMEIAVIEEINEARGNPQKFVGYLEEYKKAMKGNVIYLPNRNGISMIEGVAAIDDAIDNLKKLSKVDSLSISNGLFKAANLQLTDLKRDSTLSHKGKNGSDLEIRLLKFGFPGDNFAENICYQVSIAREVVMTMILDDGLKTRPHRKNVFSPKFKYVGVACGVSDKKDSLCVAVFADSFRERN